MEYNEIEKMRQQVKEADLKIKWDKLQEELLKIKEKYLNKYYSSHNFRYSRLKQYKSNVLSLLHINKVYIGELYGNDVIETFEQFKAYYDRNRLYVICEGESKRISKYSDTISIDVGTSKNVAHKITGFKGEVDENTYKGIDTLVTESIDYIFNTPIKNVPHFEYSKCDQIKVLEEYGETIIEITEAQANSLEGHPFLYPDKKLLVNNLSKQIIVDRIEQERKADAEDVGFYFQGERIRRIGNHARILSNLIEVLNIINEKLCQKKK